MADDKKKKKDLLRRIREWLVSKADPEKGAFGSAKQIKELEEEEKAEKEKRKKKK